MDKLIRRMQIFAEELTDQVEEKTMELEEEKSKTDYLLFQLMPRHVKFNSFQFKSEESTSRYSWHTEHLYIQKNQRMPRDHNDDRID